MQLMDPKSQYQQRLEDGLSLQDAIIAQIDTLLDHTPYILSPKVTEPEKSWLSMCGG